MTIQSTAAGWLGAHDASGYESASTSLRLMEKGSRAGLWGDRRQFVMIPWVGIAPGRIHDVFVFYAFFSFLYMYYVCIIQLCI